jgi:uncharacterized protein
MYVFGAILIGFVAAFLAGMFGIGGAGVTTPAIRVLLGASPEISLGTTLPVTIPTAASGAITYYRQGFVEKKVAAYCCLSGLVGAVAGALVTRVINLHYLMLLTGGIIMYLSGATIYRGVTGHGIDTEPAETPPDIEESDACEEPAPTQAGSAVDGKAPVQQGGDCQYRDSIPLMLAIGLAGGLLSGLLGVGGGLILVPSFIYILRMPLKRTFGTSLAVIAVIAVPGTIVHALLGHISWILVLYLTVGSIPGAYLGARLSIRTGERALYILFGLLLGAFGLVFIVNEIISMVG